jgi:hypothetical protein
MLYERESGQVLDLTGDNVSERQPDWIHGTDDYVFSSGRIAGTTEQHRFASLLRRDINAAHDAFVSLYAPSHGNVLTPHPLPCDDVVLLSKIAETSDDFLLWTVPLLGGAATAVTSSGSTMEGRWSPDGHLVGFHQGLNLLVSEASGGAAIDTIATESFTFDWCNQSCGEAAP